jgi:hypothetical protein
MEEYTGITNYPDSCIAVYLLSSRRKRGSKRKSGAPDFFRLPCGAKAVFRIPAVYFTPRFQQ